MKKFLTTLCKVILFFIGWALCAGLIPVPDTSNPVIWRLWAEIIPLVSIIVFTLVFWLIDKKKVKLQLMSSPVKSSAMGIVAGVLWLGMTVLILFAAGIMRIESSNQISLIGIWIISVFLNTVMQEMLVRGYLYRMIEMNYNTVSAGIVTTILFTLMHGGAFEAGIIPVLNVITMSIFMNIVLVYTKSLTAPIFIHFIWNGIGAIILGGVSLADDYPHLLNLKFSGNELLSGGSCKIEGSIVVLLINLLFIAIFAILYKRKQRKSLS